MGQKMQFVERAAAGEAITALCREFGVSRQTGHKWIRRFKEQGYEGLAERSRRPAGTPLATAEDVVLGVLRERKRHPTWGPRKLAVVLARQLGDHAPSERTIARILKRAELVRARRRARPVNVVDRAPCVQARKPNDVWTIDFKGWWQTLDGERANPLTVRDAFSRLVLAVTLCAATTEAVREALTRLFRRHGVPRAVQCDNGTPFVSVRSPGGVSALSAWLMSLGVAIVRSRPASPQDNGGHERMHRDMSAEVEALPAEDVAAQQKALDRWRQEFNHVRPHDALGGRTPAEVYKPEPSEAPKEKPFAYPTGVRTVRVDKRGNVRVSRNREYLSIALAGHVVGYTKVGETKAKFWFRDVELCTMDVEPEVDESIYAMDTLEGEDRAAAAAE